MISESKRPIHFGVNYLIAPVSIPVDTKNELEFRKQLADSKIEFDRTERAGRFVKFFSQKGQPLEVRVGQAGPQVGQLLILAPQPSEAEAIFIEQTEIICRAFQSVWEIEKQQIISRDACVRYLYQSSANHAFSFIWENRLKQSSDSMKILGRPVLGGGLRLVMPPNEQNRTQVEVKVESSLNDSRMLFIELQFAWPNPASPADGFRPKEMLMEIQQYHTQHLVPFILESIKD